MSALKPFRWLAVAAFLACISPAGFSAQPTPEELTCEVKLIWGSNEEKSPDPKHKKVDTEVTQWLSKKYQWKHYFEVKVETVKVPAGGGKTVELSHGNSVEIKNANATRVEARLIGQGKEVGKVATKGAFPKGERLVIGGPDKNDSAWFVVIKNVSAK